MLEFNEGQPKEMSNCTIATAYSYKPNTLQAAKNSTQDLQKIQA